MRRGKIFGKLFEKNDDYKKTIFDNNTIKENKKV
jgi:hypothetical protein